MLGKYGEAVVVDWGLAKIIHVSGAEDEHGKSFFEQGTVNASPGTGAGNLVGTPVYMSPEQASGSVDSVGPASDVYSLGATLYCMLTGNPPFDSRDPNLTAKVRTGSFPRPRTVCPLVSPALEAITLKAMATNPEDRYVSPMEISADIERWLADEPVSVYVDQFSARFARLIRRHHQWLWSLVITGGISMLIAATIVATARESRDTTLAMIGLVIFFMIAVLSGLTLVGIPYSIGLALKKRWNRRLLSEANVGPGDRERAIQVHLDQSIKHLDQGMELILKHLGEEGKPKRSLAERTVSIVKSALVAIMIVSMFCMVSSSFLMMIQLEFSRFFLISLVPFLISGTVYAVLVGQAS
jgi:hypothetical protein